MSEQAVTYVTDEMREQQGQWTEPYYSEPISTSDIRKWAMATYWPEKPPRIYWDADYAKTTQWGGIIAPPDFNPFAWPIERPKIRLPGPARPDGKPLTGMNGGQTDTYGAPMRPGDVISSRSRARRMERARRPSRLDAVHDHRNRVAQPQRRAGENPDVDRHPLLSRLLTQSPARARATGDIT